MVTVSESLFPGEVPGDPFIPDEGILELIREISAQTGGSSLGGAWSAIFGLQPGQPASPWAIPQLPIEAADVQRCLESRLSQKAKAQLDVLIGLGNG